jgi:hypothetical protein
MARRSEQVFFTGLGWALLALLSLVVAVLVFKTLQAALAGRICVPE